MALFEHGHTLGGYPVLAAVALANLDIFEHESLNNQTKQHWLALRATVEKLCNLPIVGGVCDEGYFFGTELVKG